MIVIPPEHDPSDTTGPIMDRFPDYDDRQDNAEALKKRLGQRYDIRIPIEWTQPREGRFKPKPKIENSTTDDWSLTGLGFTAPTRDDLRTPCPIIITVGPVTGQGIIVVIRPADEPGMSRYGVEFRDQGLENVARSLMSIHLDKTPADRPARKAQPDILGAQYPDYSEWN